MDDFVTKCMNIPVKNIVHVCSTYWDARTEYLDFYATMREDGKLIKAARGTQKLCVELFNGEIHHFVPRAKFKQWTIGRTYWKDGVLYHGDFPVRKDVTEK